MRTTFTRVRWNPCHDVWDHTGAEPRKTWASRLSCSNVQLMFRSLGQRAFVNWAFPCLANSRPEPFAPYGNRKTRFPGLLSNRDWDAKGSHALDSLFSRKTFGEMSGWRLFPVQTAFQSLWLKPGFRKYCFKMHRPGWNHSNWVAFFSALLTFLHASCPTLIFIFFSLLSPVCLCFLPASLPTFSFLPSVTFSF